MSVCRHQDFRRTWSSQTGWGGGDMFPLPKDTSDSMAAMSRAQGPTQES